METEIKVVDANEQPKELTAEQKAALAIQELNKARAARLEAITAQIKQILDDNGCDLVVEHNIKVIPRQK